MSKPIIKYGAIISIFAYSFASAAQVFAATTPPPTIGDLAPMIENVANIITPVAIILAVGMIVFSG